MNKKYKDVSGLRATLKFIAGLWVWIIGVSLALSALPVKADRHAEKFRYKYINLAKIELPPGVTSFFGSRLRDDGKLYGTACLADDCRIAFYENGKLTVSAVKARVSVVNSRGTIGGSAVDPVDDVIKRVLVHGNKIEFIPPQPDEVFSTFLTLNDHDIAFLESFTETDLNYVLYRRGVAAPIDFGPLIVNPRFNDNGKSLNNSGEIAGRTGADPFKDGRGFRYDLRTGKATILQPASGDTLAWGMGINNRGDVLGYSFTRSTPTTPYRERIGVWDRKGRFNTYFSSSDLTNTLVFNDHNLIAASIPKTYLITRPGVRFKLEDLVVNLPPGVNILSIFNMNNRGDMLGNGSDGRFLLKRLCDN